MRLRIYFEQTYNASYTNYPSSKINSAITDLYLSGYTFSFMGVSNIVRLFTIY